MNEISIEEDDKHITAILARVDDDEGSLAGCVLEIGKERRKKELLGKDRVGRNVLHSMGVTGREILGLKRTRTPGNPGKPVVIQSSIPECVQCVTYYTDNVHSSTINILVHRSHSSKREMR